MERLQKVMAHAGVGSRRKCEELIRQGRVKVNGRTVLELGTKVDPVRDEIEVNGQPVTLEDNIYILFYKPIRVITSVRDPQGRKVVTDFIDVEQRIYPVGRLDYDTEGLLLLTNDGELANKMMHPRHELDKVYRAEVKGVPEPEVLKKLAAGVKLEDGWTAPGKAKLLRSDRRKNRSLLEITIHEGRNRQVRRMCEAIGHPVVRLKRTAIGFLTLEGLKPGKYRTLREEEVERIKGMVT